MGLEKTIKEGCAIGKATLRGHYCKVCGQHKASERFSGKGHAAHICKECSHLTPAEQAESMTLTRLYALPVNRLSESEKKWLENRTHDKRPAVKELACEVYRKHYPHTERNAMKKRLQIDQVKFTVHSCPWDDELEENRMIYREFEVNRKADFLIMLDLEANAAPSVVETEDTAELVKWMLNSLEIFCWEEDYCGERMEPGTGIDFSELPGFEFLAESDTGDEKCDPTWSVRIKYSNGHEQYIESYDFGLPDRVEELYNRLSSYFTSEKDEDEFDFVEQAFACQELTELGHLVSTLLTYTEGTQRDDLIAMALMDMSTLSDDGDMQRKPGQRPYRTYSGASACVEFLRSFLTQTMAGETRPTQNGVERLRRFVEYMRKNITFPGGELISPSDLDRTMHALEKRYGLISRLSQAGTLEILRIPNSHRTFNSICNATKRMDGTDSFRYALYLFHVKDEDSGHPAYILLHEIGHALQVELTRDPALIPESFCNMSDLYLGKPVDQSPLAAELFADAFAIGMIQIFGWDAFGTFDELAPEVKNAFATYMNWLLEKEVSKKTTIK